MYQVFDEFLASDTWPTNHPNDGTRFFIALARVVNQSGFSPDAMGQYMRQRVNNPALTTAVDYYVSAAWTIVRYLEVTRVR